MYPTEAVLSLTSPSDALLERSNVEFLDVATYCDKLRLAITRPRNGSKPSARNGSVARIGCEGETLSFRLASNLYHSTLSVYKMQVDSLLERSKALLTRSEFDLIGLTATKRKSSVSITGVSARKRLRKTVKDINISSYTELLDESENLQHWSKCHITLNEQGMNDGSKSKMANSRLVQIREITIREINADASRTSLDDDSGFGNATTEELNEFVQLFAENHEIHSDKAAHITKRKGSIDASVAEKMAKIDDDSGIEMPRSANENIESPFRMTAGVDIHAVSSSDEEINIDINSIILSLDKETGSNSKAADTGFSVKQSNATNPDPLFSLYISPSHSTNAQKKRQKKSQKLLIDKVTKLTGREMIAQLNCPKTGTVCNYRVNTDKFIPARQLLTTFGRKSSHTLGKVFKRMRKLGEDCARNEYISLLRDILNRNVDDQLCGEITSNWNAGTAQACTRKYKHRRRFAETDSAPDEKRPSEEDFINNNKHDLAAHSGGKSVEWNAYGVMMKLLDMWRCHDNGDEIAVTHIFPVKTVSRKEAASGFFSLLLLSSRCFIELIKAPDSVTMQQVKLGAASEKLIRQAQVSSLA